MLGSNNFFSVLQRLYAFFVASTHRWERLLRKRKSNKTLKSLSSTRWSCRDDATETSADDYGGVYDALTEISQDENEENKP